MIMLQTIGNATRKSNHNGCQKYVLGSIPVRLTYGTKGGAPGSILRLKFADKVESTFVWPLGKHNQAACRLWSCSGT